MSMADMMLQPSPLCPNSFLKKKTQQNHQKKKTLKPHTKQQQNPEKTSVNLILLSFFVQVLIQSIYVVMFFAFGMKNISASAPQTL